MTVTFCTSRDRFRLDRVDPAAIRDISVRSFASFLPVASDA